VADIDTETIAAFVTLYAVLSEFIGASKLKENTVYQVVIRILASLSPVELDIHRKKPRKRGLDQARDELGRFMREDD
jgi:hypothetical protein